MTVLAAAALWLYQQWDERRDWRPVENAKVVSLRSAYLMEKVRAELGAPSERTVGRGARIGAEFFHRRSYWLEVIYTTDTRQVLGWVVTACERDFSPSFTIGDDRVTLWKTTVATDIGGLEHKFRFEPAHTIHQPNQLISYGRLPGSRNFVGLVWGAVDVCGDSFPAAADIISKATSAYGEGFTYTGEASRCRRCVTAGRDAVINMYGEFYTGMPLDDLYPLIGFGPRRSVAGGRFTAGY